MTQQNHFKASKKITQARVQWKVVNDLSGGTAKMREAGTEYLPKFGNEDQSSYNIRKDNTTLLNVYGNTIKTNVGKIFSKPIVVKDTNHNILLKFANNVDGAGSTITQFCKKTLESAINYGASYILIDYPIMDENATYKDEQDASPFWIRIESTQVLEVRSEKINGVQQLTYFRYLEQVPDMFDRDTINDDKNHQVKVFWLDKETSTVNFEVWRKNDENKEVLVNMGVVGGQKNIPIVPVYTNMVDFFLGQPVLFDLAEMNIQHWQSSSDQRNILRIARVPMLQVKGYNAEFDSNGKATSEITISPNTILSFPDSPSSGASWIEHGGTAIEAGRQDLKDIEKYMSVLGLELHTQGTTNGSETATSRILEHAEATSLLKDIALSFKMSIEKALEFTMLYSDLDINTFKGIEMNTEIKSVLVNTSDLTNLMEMFKLGQISSETLLKESVRRDFLSTDTNISEILKNQQTTNDNNKE